MLFKNIFYRICDLANQIPIWMKDLSPEDYKVEVIYPKSLRKSPVSKHLPGQLDRVRAVAFGGSVSDEIGQFLGNEREINATLRFEIGGALVNRGIIYTGGGRRVISNLNKKNEFTGVNSATDIASLRTSFLGSYYFGHWLRDDCATAMIEDEGMKFFTPSPKWPDKKAYRDVFKLDIPTAALLYAKRVIFYDDVSQNEHKIERIRKIRAGVQAQLSGKSSPEIVYVKRGDGGEARRLVNETEIIDALTSKGVLCVSAEDLETPVIESIFGCRLFISVEGSQISHAVYGVRDGGGVIVLQPPDRFFNSHLDWAVPLGIQYGSIVGLPDKHGFRIPVDEIFQTIDLFQ
jgi:Glycosyltransferase 61